MAYDNNTKYIIIEELCNGKTASDIQREHGIGVTTVMKWLRILIDKGAFNKSKLTPDELAKLENFKEKTRNENLS